MSQKIFIFYFLIILISVVVFPIFSAKAQGSCKPADVVLVIDTSGSMDTTMNGVTRMEATKTAAKTFTTLLLPGGTINREAVVRFASSASIYLNWNNDAGFINTEITKLSAIGCTNYMDALQKTIGVLGGARVEATKVVIFMSDGRPAYPPFCFDKAPPYTEEENKAKEVKSIATLYTIAFAAPVEGKTLLKAMATSPAQYYETSDPTTLEAIYKAIFLDLNDKDGDGFYDASCPGGNDWDDGPPKGTCINPNSWEGMICGACPVVTDPTDPPTKISVGGKDVWVCSVEPGPGTAYSETNVCVINCNDTYDNDQDGAIDLGDDECPIPAGLVPCGRQRDAAETLVNEESPCTLCHGFVLAEKIVEKLTLYIIIPLGILMIVVGGAMFSTSAGDPGRIATSKKILTATIIGLVIIFLAWVIVNTVIFFLSTGQLPLPGQIGEILGRPWHEVICPVPEYRICR